MIRRRLSGRFTAQVWQIVAHECHHPGEPLRLVGFTVEEAAALTQEANRVLERLNQFGRTQNNGAVT